MTADELAARLREPSSLLTILEGDWIEFDPGIEYVEDPAWPGSETVTGAEAISERSAGNLEQGIGDKEAGEDPAHLSLAETQVSRDLGSSLREGDSIDIGDDRKRHGENDDQIADMSGAPGDADMILRLRGHSSAIKT